MNIVLCHSVEIHLHTPRFVHTLSALFFRNEFIPNVCILNETLLLRMEFHFLFIVSQMHLKCQFMSSFVQHVEWSQFNFTVANQKGKTVLI